MSTHSDRTDPTRQPRERLGALDRIAAPRAGIVTREQLGDAGWSPSAVDRAIRRGQLVTIHGGIYRVAGAPMTRRAAMIAASEVAGPGALMAGWTSAELLGFGEPRRGPLHMVVPHGRRVPASAEGLVRVRRSRRLDASDRTERDGIAVTAGHRTLLDLAAVCSCERLGELMASALRTGSTDRETLEATLDHRRSFPGRRRFADALELVGNDAGNSRSDVEVAALNALVTAGLPRPVVALRVRDAGGRFVAEVDLAYPDRRLAIEIDGYRWHSSPGHKQRDERRQNRLVTAGWRVLRFGAGEVRTDPRALVSTISKVLGA